LHGLARDFAFLLTARALLGMGEGGAFPAATRVVAEWVPPARRSTAMGIINAGTAAGSLLAPPLIGLVLLVSGWRTMFLAAGAAVPSAPATPPPPIFALARMRQVWVLVFAKFLSDSAWYFYLFWLPKYLY